MRVRSHAAAPLRGQRRELGKEAPAGVEKLIRLVALHPLLEDFEVLGLGGEIGDGNLMRAKRTLDGKSVDRLGSGPALGAVLNDHGPLRALGEMTIACGSLDG